MGREQGQFPHFKCPYGQWSFHYNVHNLYYFVYMSGLLFIVGIPTRMQSCWLLGLIIIGASQLLLYYSTQQVGDVQ